MSARHVTIDANEAVASVAYRPERFRRLAAQARVHAERRVALYEQLSHIILPQPARPGAGGSPNGEHAGYGAARAEREGVINPNP